MVTVVVTQLEFVYSTPAVVSGLCWVHPDEFAAMGNIAMLSHYSLYNVLITYIKHLFQLYIIIVELPDALPLLNIE
jgi:hypothetical protein